MYNLDEICVLQFINLNNTRHAYGQGGRVFYDKH